MTRPNPSSDPLHPVDAVVRAHLEAEAATVDARAVLARVKAGPKPAEPSTRRSVWVRWVTIGGGVAVAAGVLIALFLTGQTPIPDKQLTAAELVQEAITVHKSTPTDRCYSVSADWDVTPFLKRFRFQPAVRQGRVWTRGDQFVMLSAVDDGPHWAWGQEQSGRVWLAPNRKNAIVFDWDELNEPVARFCELMSLRLVTTLSEVLDKCELFRQDGGGPGEPIRIDAKLRPRTFPQSRFRQVELELDPVTKLVRRAVLHRYLNGESVGTLTFMLLETDTKPADFYSLGGHVEPNAVVHDGRSMPNPPPPPLNPRATFRDELFRRLQLRTR